MAQRDADAQLAFRHAAQHEAQHQRQEREVERRHDRAQDAHAEEDPDVEHAAVEGVAADDAEHHDDGEEDLARQAQGLHHKADAVDEHQQHEDDADEEGQVDEHDQLGIVAHQQGARLQALQHEGAEHHHGGGVAGDAQCQQRDHGATGGSAAGHFRSDDAVGVAGTEGLGFLGRGLGLGVGHDIGQAGAHAGQDADARTDQGGADDVLPLAEHVQGHTPEFTLREGGVHDGVGFADAADLDQDLRDGEHTDEHRHDAEAGLEVGDAEVETRHAVGLTQAHAGKQQAQCGRDEALDQRLVGNGDDAAQGEQDEREIFAGAEVQGKGAQRRRQEHQTEEGEDTAEEGRENAVGQGPAGQAFLGHGVCVKGGGHTGGRAGDVQQRGRDQAAGDAADIDGHQQDKAVVHVHAVGDGHQQGHSHGGSQSGKSADDQAAENPANHQHDGK